MFEATSPYEVRKCSKCNGDAAYICITCSCKMCVECEQFHVNDIRSIDHNVVIISEKEYEGKEDIYSKYIEENTTIKRQQYGGIIHTISSDAILSRRFILKEIKNDIKTCHSQTNNVQSEMQNVAQNMKDSLNNWIMKIDSPHICLNKKKELERYFSVIQRHEQRYEHSYIRPVRFLSFIKKTGIHAVYFRITYNKGLFVTDSIKRKDVKKLLSVKLEKKRVRSIRNECLLNLMEKPELQHSFYVNSIFQCQHISFVTSDRLWVNDSEMLILTNSKGDTLFNVEDFCDGLHRYTGGVHTVNSKQELFYLHRRYHIKKLSKDMKTKTIFVKRTSFLRETRCLYSSPRTDDLLVGTCELSLWPKTGMVYRYDQSGKLIQSIIDNEQGQKLFKEPNYLTENNNGDIIVSDLLNGVVVTDYHGRHRFSFSKHPNGRSIEPFGICTDELSHIIVYNNDTKTVLVIDKDGNFIFDMRIGIFEPEWVRIQQGISLREVTPLSLSYDVTSHRLWVGTSNTSRLYAYMHITRQNALKEIDEWEDPEVLKQKRALKARKIFKEEDILKKHQSISGYIHGSKNGLEVVKVFLRYDDNSARLEMKENILEGLNEEFIIIPDRIKEIKKILTPFTEEENSYPEVDVVEMNRIGKIISNRASYVYRNHSDVFGLRISNVRCVDGKFKQEPCIVIYCLDKSFIPSGENKLPETLEGYPCDIRENIIMFGGGASLGSSVGIPYNGTFGSVGFLVKSNVPSLIPVSGFLTAAHVAIKELDKLHDEKALLSECKQRKRCEFAKQNHFIVQPAWPHSGSGKPVGEVVESFCGNYKPYGEGKYNPSFGMDAAFINTYPPKPEVKEESIMEVVDENSLTYDRSTKVLKRGNVTKETNGILISNTASIAIRSELNNEYVYQFDNCYEIRSSEQNNPFFKAGDSGSAVFVHEGDEIKPLGIAFAFSADETTCACRIDQIVQAFNLSIYQEEEDMDTQDD